MAKNHAERRLRQRLVGYMFVKHPATVNLTECVYCGEVPIEWDHFLPLKFVHMLAVVEPELAHPYRRWMFLVPACKECNVLVGTEVFTSFDVKKTFIKEKIESRYRKILELPDWTEQELIDAGEGLASAVRASTRQRDEIRNRLDYEPPVIIGPLEYDPPVGLK